MFKLFKKEENRLFLGHYNLNQILTMITIVIGFISIYLSSTGKFKTSVIVLILSGIVYIVSAIVRTKETDKYNLTYSIIMSAVAKYNCFVVSPVFITLNIVGYNHLSTIVICLLYLLAGLISITHAETYKIYNQEHKLNTGIPVIYMSAIYPIYYMIDMILGEANFDLGITLILLIFSFIIIFPIKRRKMSDNTRSIVAMGGFILIIILLILK